MYEHLSKCETHVFFLSESYPSLMLVLKMKKADLPDCTQPWGCIFRVASIFDARRYKMQDKLRYELQRGVYQLNAVVSHLRFVSTRAIRSF